MIEKWKEYLKKNRGYAAGTVRGYETNLREFATWLRKHGVTRWNDVTDTTVNEYVKEQVESGKTPATIGRKVSAIRSFYNWGRRSHLTDANPAKYVSTPKNPKRLPTTIDTDAIRATIWDKTIDRETRGIIATMIETGMRISEVLNIQTTNIDTNEQSIRIVGKGNKERKTYYGAVTSNYLKKHMPTTGKLFDVEDETARRNIYFALSKHASGHPSSHQLRHTFATETINSGMQLTTLAKLMGHTDIRTTEKYLAVSDNQTRREYQQKSITI